MSRIFDALQRSGAEKSGIEYPDMLSMVTEVLEPSNPGAEAPAWEQAAVDPSALDSSVLDRPDLDRTDLDHQDFDRLSPRHPASSSSSLNRIALPESPRGGLDTFPSLTIHLGPSSRVVLLTEPDSLAAEKFRFLGVRLRQLQQTRPLKRVLITSTIAEEGKSLVSANLAAALARRKQKVLLIEGDLRCPTLSDRFGLGRLAGLGEWLQGDHRQVSNLYRLEGPDFWLMPAGHPLSNPLELMQGGGLSELMKQLANLFDWVIVDSPPLLPLADTTVWARVTDGTLLVAREGKTEKSQLERGLEILKKSDLLGVVLNGCTHPNHKSYYQRYPPSGR